MYTALLAGTALLVAGELSAQSTGKGAARQLNALGTVYASHQGEVRGGGPANDGCGSVTAESLALGGSLTFSGDNTGATMDGDYEVGSALEGAGFPSVWHAFTTTECANVTLSYCNSSDGFSGNFWIVISTACPTGDANMVFNSSYNATECANATATINFVDLPAGTYYVPVLTDEANGIVGAYSIEVTASACIPPPPAPANDDCSGVIALPVNDWCNFQYFSGTGVTETLPAVTCNDFTGNATDDVWFSFVATAADMTIAAQGNDDGDGDVDTGYDAVMELFSGDCGTGTSIGCADATLGNELEQIDASGLTVGTTYYVRVYDWYNVLWPDHAFGICVTTNGEIGIGIEENGASEWNLFPNPNEGAFTLNYTGATGNANIEVRDVTGRVVFRTAQRVTNNAQLSIDMGTIASGNYLVNLAVNGAQTNVRVAVK